MKPRTVVHCRSRADPVWLLPGSLDVGDWHGRPLLGLDFPSAVVTGMRKLLGAIHVVAICCVNRGLGVGESPWHYGPDPVLPSQAQRHCGLLAPVTAAIVLRRTIRHFEAGPCFYCGRPTFRPFDYIRIYL